MDAQTLAHLHKAMAHASGASSDFDLNPEIPPDTTRPWRPAAVLMALQMTAQGPAVLLTKRAAHLAHHAGQIAFPGGKIDAQDSSPEAAALREAQEEVGLPPDQVTLIGRLPHHDTVTGYRVTPIVAHITAPFTPIIDTGEVAETFAAPLTLLTSPASYRIEARRWRGSWRRYYTIPFGPYYIWGATARILRGFAERWQA